MSALAKMTYEEHAEWAGARARAFGAADSIHFAPYWKSRSDALYEAAHAEYASSGLEWWEGTPGGSPALLEDGRMVVMCVDVWFVELKA